jgi:hypothetical protein
MIGATPCSPIEAAEAANDCAGGGCGAQRHHDAGGYWNRRPVPGGDAAMEDARSGTAKP